MGKSVITLKLFLILTLIFLSQSIKTNAQQNIPQNSCSYLVEAEKRYKQINKKGLRRQKQLINCKGKKKQQ